MREKVHRHGHARQLTCLIDGWHSMTSFSTGTLLAWILGASSSHELCARSHPHPPTLPLDLSMAITSPAVTFSFCIASIIFAPRS